MFVLFTFGCQSISLSYTATANQSRKKGFTVYYILEITKADRPFPKTSTEMTTPCFDLYIKMKNSADWKWV